MSSSVGYQNDERTIACVIVNRDSNEKQAFKAGDNIVGSTYPEHEFQGNFSL